MVFSYTLTGCNNFFHDTFQMWTRCLLVVSKNNIKPHVIFIIVFLLFVCQNYNRNLSKACASMYP